MVMVDVGQTFSARHFLNLEWMGTAERWTYPSNGTPELLQIGEDQQDHQPFLDAQHPHSSPIMGLTLSDTLTLGSQNDHLSVWFAPRGASTDGPIPFMHRPTGTINPAAPLGHHIGQDVGHISSTVVGTSLQWGSHVAEISTFNGTEPDPTHIDLPVAMPNSFAGRFTQVFTSHLFAMVSFANVAHPEAQDPTIINVQRYSASLYADASLASGWFVHHALIWGLIKNYDHAPNLHSFAEEAWFRKNSNNLWGRLEVLQRTPAELQIPVPPSASSATWIVAATVGYTYQLPSVVGCNLGLGGALTLDVLPGAFRTVYGTMPVTGNVFLQVSGMDMWDLMPIN
jgi:hypothetical protein